jgi:hypothetical protein
MEELGYVISELPALVFVIWFAVRLFQFRRRQRNQPPFSDRDRRLLFGTAGRPVINGMFLFKFGLAIVAVSLIGVLEILVLEPLGAAILSGVLLLTSIAIVHNLLEIED